MSEFDDAGAKQPPRMTGSSNDKSVDPTALTTQLVWREIGSLKELVMARMDAMQTAIDVAHADLVRVPTDVQKQVGNLKELHEEKIKGLLDVHEEKFKSIQTQFRERDIRADQTAKDAKSAIDAAFAASKEAIAKSETATSKQIELLGNTLSTTSNGLNDKISDVKDRVNRMEGTGAGAAIAVSTRQASGSYTVGIIGAVVGLVGLVAALLALRT